MMYKVYYMLGLTSLVVLQIMSPTAAFSSTNLLNRRTNELSGSSSTALSALYSPGRSASRNNRDKSKRQYRVGQLVQTELGRILHSGLIKGDSDYIEAELRQRISIVSVDVSPDLRQARVSISVRKGDSTDGNAAVDKRRAYSWLVENAKPLRHTLAQKMSHMKTSPDLTFVQVDVGAAVDVMYLIEKVSSGYSREKIGQFGGDDDNLPKGYIADQDFDEEFEEGEWDDEDDDFFGSDDDKSSDSA